MTPEYILRHSLSRKPHCAGPHDVAFENWTPEHRATYLRAAESEIEYMQYAPAYAERGYDDPAKGILFANWNYFSREVSDILERAGYAIEWSDEWTTCCNCGKALRTSADSYGWRPSYLCAVDDSDYCCIDCADIESVLESYEDNPNRAFNDHVNPADYGYEQIEGDFENGWHPGQNDDPKAIFKRLREAGHDRILFTIDSVGQFDMRFSAWKKIVD